MRKFLIASLAMVLALGVMGGAFAAFQDTETSSGNTFTSGTMELKVTDGDPEDWGDDCSGTWILDEIIPGADTIGVDEVTATVSLRTVGTIIPNHLEIQASISLNESENPVESDDNPFSSAAEMAAKLEITQLQYDGLGLLNPAYLKDADGDGKKTLNDLTFDPDGVPTNGLDDLPPPATGITGTSFMMTVHWIEGADDNDFQGDTLHLTVIFTLNQDASQ